MSRDSSVDAALKLTLLSWCGLGVLDVLVFVLAFCVFGADGGGVVFLRHLGALIGGVCYFGLRDLAGGDK